MTASASPLAPRGTSAGVRTCGACGARIADEAWTSLALSKRIEASEVRALVSDWPDEYCIEVRSCDHCGGLVASKRHRGPVTLPLLKATPSKSHK
jgi:hypothetical protein